MKHALPGSNAAKRDDRKQPAPVRDVMSLPEVTGYLGCSKTLVHRLVRRGEFPGFSGGFRAESEEQAALRAAGEPRTNRLIV